jgi:6-phosphogluconolactonase (cycloisomerase 2 family)
MRTRFPWIVAILVLVSIGLLVACSTKYSSSSDGLVVVPDQGDYVIQSFSVNLSNGSISTINNVNGPPAGGLPTSVILDPPGAFAYVIVQANPAVPGSVNGISTFQIASDGKLGYIATTQLTNPVAMAMDSAGKFLFVANGSEGTISVFLVGSNASLTEIANSPFALTLPVGGQSPSASALAVTPTVYPELYSSCSGQTPPTTENLYVTDSINYLLLNYSVDPSAGTLALVPTPISTGVPTGTVPDGVAIDPCNRFAYVANGGPGSGANTVSAYTMCSVASLPTCPNVDFSLHPVTGSPYPTQATSPGPITVDAYGNFLYVVNTGSYQVSEFRISPSTGALSALSPANVSTGLGPNSIAVRRDDSFVFVANMTSASVTQYSIGLSTGVLTTIGGPISTFNYPSGVAVK